MLNDYKRNEIFKAAVFIILLVFSFLPISVKGIIIALMLIYIIFDMVRSKKNGYPKYHMIFNLFLALAATLAIIYILIETKFTGLSTYENYIKGVFIIVAVIITIPLPLVIRYKQGGWKNLKPGIWVAAGWTILYIAVLQKLFIK
jgi:hypothetical protein